MYYDIFHCKTGLSQLRKSIKTYFIYLFSNHLMAVVMKGIIFWDITPCIPLKVNWRFGGTCRPHLHGRIIRRARNQRESRWLGLFFDPEDGGDMFLRNVGWLSTDYTGAKNKNCNINIYGLFQLTLKQRLQNKNVPLKHSLPSTQHFSFRTLSMVPRNTADPPTRKVFLKTVLFNYLSPSYIILNKKFTNKSFGNAAQSIEQQSWRVLSGLHVPYATCWYSPVNSGRTI
jgi:hypothetical protein